MSASASHSLPGRSSSLLRCVFSFLCLARFVAVDSAAVDAPISDADDVACE